MGARRSAKTERSPSRAARKDGVLKRLRRAGQRLRQIEKRHAIAMGAINESVYDWDIADDKTYFSSGMERVLGLPPNALKSLRDWYERIHPDDFPRYRDATIAHLKGRSERFECDYRYRAQDGSWHWARSHGLAIRNRRGRAIRMIGSTGDITELKASEERYALATSVAVEGIYEWNVQTGQLFLSSRAKDFFALPAGELTPAAWIHRIHGDDFAAYRAAIIDHFKGRTSQLEHEYRISDGRGGYRWVLDRGIGVRDARGRVIKVIGALSDITPRKEAEFELRRARDQAEQALAQQTATAEILRATLGSPTDLQRVFQAILTNASRLCEASFAGLFLFEGGLLYNVAQRNASEDFALALQRMRARPSRETTTRRCALERRTIHTTDLLNDPDFSPPQPQRRENVRTALSVPMLREGALFGVITLWRGEVRPFSDYQIALVQTFADQAVIAIENVRLFHETREALERQTATAEILGVISSSPTDTQPVFEAIVRSGLKLFPGAAVAVALPDGDQVRFAAIADRDLEREEAWKSRFPFPLTRDYMHGVAILDGRLVDVPDARDAPPGLEVGCTNFLASGYRAATMMPMMRGSGAIGAVSVLRLEPGPLTDRQLAVLRTFADQAVIAIENARLFRELQARNRELTESLEQQTATAETLKVIAGTPSNVQPVFDAIVRNAVHLGHAAVGFLISYDGTTMELVAQHNIEPRLASIFRSAFPRPASRDTMTGRSICEREVINIPDISASDFSEGPKDRARRAGSRSALVVPLLRGGEPIGALNIQRREAGGFSDAFIGLLKTFADQAVIAIENVRLFHETREALEQQKASGEVLEAISSSIADTRPVFDKILESCERLFAGKTVGVNLVGDDSQIHMGAYHGPGRDALAQIFPLAVDRESGSGRAIVDARVINYADTEDEREVPAATRRGCAAIGIKSAIFAPMLWQGEGMGAIFVGREHKGRFSESEVALLRTFADQAVIAIQNARLFRETEVANRHKSEFLASMSHELRTPLNAIIGFTRIVMRRSREQLEPKQYENLEKILASSQHLLMLINAILDLSKIEAGRLDMHVAEFELAPVLEQCLRTVEPLVKADAVKLIRDFDGALPALVADEEKLRQIVINLLSNAAKFTPRGNIRLRARAADGAVRVVVVDTGIGIAADKLGLIFEEFRQADDGSTREYGGTGLGLAIARRLARLMGGEIDVVSQPGSGSTFTLTLPVGHSA